MTTEKLLHPVWLMFGTHRPDIRFKQVTGSQVNFCRHNLNVHLTERDFSEGTYEAGNLLGALCRKHCAPPRDRATGQHQPCPAFVKSWMVGTGNNTGLATVELHDMPQWEQCAGFQKLAEIPQTLEEAYFLREYLDKKCLDEFEWRDSLVAQWNASWHLVRELFGESSRRGKFDRMLWSTLRFPALVPQVWQNWLADSSESDMKLLEKNPSRVDFQAFWRGERHVIEIDGPSHYADFNGHGYRVDESLYAQNLKIDRSLRKHGYNITRVARIEVREAMAPGVDAFFAAWDLLKVLPFYADEGYPEQYSVEMLGVPELREPELVLADDIPL